MGWRKDYWRESWRRSIPRWQRDEAMTALVAAILAIVIGLTSGFGLKFPLVGSIPIGFGSFLVALLGWHLLVVSPMHIWKELTDRVENLEAEKVPKFNVVAEGDRQLRDHQTVEHLMWAELKIRNTSPSRTLHDVEVRVVSYTVVQERQGQPGKYLLMDDYDFGGIRPSQVYWSKRDADPRVLAIDIPSGGERVALVAFSDSSNGPPGVLNAPIQQALSLGGKLEVEVTSPDSGAWKGVFYIECHPNIINSYRDDSGVIHALLGSGTKATFEFVPWEQWAEVHPLTPLSVQRKEGPET